MELNVLSKAEEVNLRSYRSKSWTSSPSRSNIIKTLGILLSLLTLVYWRGGSRWLYRIDSDSSKSDSDFSWTDVTPKKDLQYTACFDGYQCARLEVPLDWNASESGSNVVIAIIRLPAQVPVTDPRYGGAVLLNPGGPSGSGVSFVLDSGYSIRTIVDSPISLKGNEITKMSSRSKYFDVISFDPRGVNNTTPKLKCFPDKLSRDTWTRQTEAEGLIGTSDIAFENGWARARAWGESCSQHDDDQLRYHMNTTPVVADMVAIIEAHGKWREDEAKRWLRSSAAKAMTRGEKCPSEYSRAAIKERTRWREGQEKLLFWGVSYGSILGATFAAMQPHRVARVVIDGVVDASDYYQGKMMNNIQSADAIVGKFSDYCHQAGPDECPFFLGKTSEDISNELERLVRQVKETPLPVAASKMRGPEIITYSDMLWLIATATYQPLRMFGLLASVLADMSRGNGSAIADFKWRGRDQACTNSKCRRNGPYSKECDPNPNDSPEIFSGVWCSDWGDVPNNWTKKDYKNHAEVLKTQSRWLGELWAGHRLSCSNWHAPPKWKFQGPIAAETLHPILLIGNTLDPVTPIENARIMSKGFDGSVVLQQDSEGHSSFSSSSICTAKNVRLYFQTGELPEQGTVCEPERRPLIDSQRQETAERHLSEEDKALLDALNVIESRLPNVRF